MSVLASRVHAGAYADSILLMQVQSELARLPGVEAAGVIMATEVNLALLRSRQLLDSAMGDVGPSDMVVSVRADSAEAAEAALSRIESLLQRQSSGSGAEFRPRSLKAALRMAPEGSWVAISVPGRYAHSLAAEAVANGNPVFLYSDNVSAADELSLKRSAAEQRNLLLGPDCGSALIGGIGFGFTNAVRRGSIGLVSASGTGLQSVACRVHDLGAGISHAIGTGGRDLTQEIGGIATLQGLDLLARDPLTRVIVLLSKVPAAAASSRVLAAAMQIDKPLVVYFPGQPAPAPEVGNLTFVRSSAEAAEVAVALATGKSQSGSIGAGATARGKGGFLRGLFAGGTLALETALGVAPFLEPLYSNLALDVLQPLRELTRSQGHTILDLGDDALTVGRLHPMMDPSLRSERLQQETADPATGLIVFDVILGRGSHADPIAELLPTLSRLRPGEDPACVAIVIGTEDDPQDLELSRERLRRAGCIVTSSVSEALPTIVRSCAPSTPLQIGPVASACLEPPAAVINIGLESLHDELTGQGIPTVQVDWRPPAGGDDQLMQLLERMQT